MASTIIYNPAMHCGAHPDDPEKGPCRAKKGMGTDHPGTGRCKHHGGATPNGRTSARREILRAEATTLGLPRTLNPEDGFLEEIARCAGTIDWYRMRIRELDRDAVTTGVRSTRTVTAPDGKTTTTVDTAAQINAYIKLEAQERDRLVRVCDRALANNVSQREIAAIEENAAMHARLVLALIDELGIRGAERENALDIAERQFVLLQGGRAS